MNSCQVLFYCVRKYLIQFVLQTKLPGIPPPKKKKELNIVPMPFNEDTEDRLYTQNKTLYLDYDFALDPNPDFDLKSSA